MPYPHFPFSSGAKVVFFSTFDASFRGFAQEIFCDETLTTAGGGYLYNYSSGQPPARWAPAWAFYNNWGYWPTRQAGVFWTARIGPRLAMWTSDAGGLSPD